MTREHYEQSKRRLEEQLRAGIQLLEAAHQAQVRALDLVWMLQAEELAAGIADEAAALVSPEPVPPPAPAQQTPLPSPSPPPGAAAPAIWRTTSARRCHAFPIASRAATVRGPRL